MKPRPVTNLRPIGGAPDPTTAPEVHTGINKLSTDQGYSQGNQPVSRSQPTAYRAHATQPTAPSAKRSQSAPGVCHRSARVGGSGAALRAAHPHTRTPGLYRHGAPRHTVFLIPVCTGGLRAPDRGSGAVRLRRKVADTASRSWGAPQRQRASDGLAWPRRRVSLRTWPAARPFRILVTPRPLPSRQLQPCCSWCKPSCFQLPTQATLRSTSRLPTEMSSGCRTAR